MHGTFRHCFAAWSRDLVRYPDLPRRLALSGIVEYLTGFDNWALWYVIFAVVQIINTALGIKAVEFLSSIAAPAIIAISVWMYLTLDVLAVTKGSISGRSSATSS